MSAPVPAVALNGPYILVSKSGSSSGLTAEQGTFVFGTVQRIYDTCERFAVNDVVLFDPTDCVAIYDGSVKYYLVNDALVGFKDAAGAP